MLIAVPVLPKMGVNVNNNNIVMKAEIKTAIASGLLSFTIPFPMPTM
jgi:hypothetical protein